MTIWSFIRERVSQFIYWQWKKMGHASAVLLFYPGKNFS